MKKILFVAPFYPGRAPSQRFRFEQYLDYLEENGFSCTVSYLITPKSDAIFYGRGKWLLKSLLLIQFFFKRLKDLWSASKYDIVFVHREAHYLGTAWFEKAFSKRAKLVYDFDDSIWLPNVSDMNKRFVWLKRPQKTAKIISYADMVFAGNRYLADYASKYNRNVKIIPTTIDTEIYVRAKNAKSREGICIGWSGSVTTIAYFKYAVPFLLRIKEKYGDRVYFKVIGDGDYSNAALGIRGIPWRREDEISELSSMDIGIMPLPDDKWTKGKCGLKGLQYMALEIATIMSPVGVNMDIIQDGENGFLASETGEWVEKISSLIESEELRKRLGRNGRQTVIAKYSVLAYRDNYVNYLNDLLK